MSFATLTCMLVSCFRFADIYGIDSLRAPQLQIAFSRRRRRRILQYFYMSFIFHAKR